MEKLAKFFWKNVVSSLVHQAGLHDERMGSLVSQPGSITIKVDGSDCISVRTRFLSNFLWYNFFAPSTSSYYSDFESAIKQDHYLWYFQYISACKRFSTHCYLLVTVSCSQSWVITFMGYKSQNTFNYIRKSQAWDDTITSRIRAVSRIRFDSFLQLQDDCSENPRPHLGELVCSNN